MTCLPIDIHAKAAFASRDLLRPFWDGRGPETFLYSLLVNSHICGVEHIANG